MIDAITKPKISRDYSFVLKTTQLEDFLKSNNIDINVNLDYWKPQEIGSIFEVHYWFPNQNIPYDRLYIRAGAVLKIDIQLARKSLTDEVFPAFLKWLMNIDMLKKSFTINEEPYFNACFENGLLSIHTKLHI